MRRGGSLTPAPVPPPSGRSDVHSYRPIRSSIPSSTPTRGFSAGATCDLLDRRNHHAARSLGAATMSLQVIPYGRSSPQPAVTADCRPLPTLPWLALSSARSGWRLSCVRYLWPHAGDQRCRTPRPVAAPQRASDDDHSTGRVIRAGAPFVPTVPVRCQAGPSAPARSRVQYLCCLNHSTL